MGPRGNLTTTDLRKKNIPQSVIPALGAKTILMHHEATLGDTGIDLTNLVPVTDYLNQGIINPSVNEILAMNLAYNSKNLKITSSLNNTLMRLSFKMTGPTDIAFIDYVAAAGEIFEIEFAPSIVGGMTMVDARPLVYTGILAEGETEITFSDTWEYNKNPTHQIGAVAFYRGGSATLQLRNVNNAAASMTADGNYQELPGFGGATGSVKFNTPGAVGGETIIAMSVGALAERPVQSQISLIESILGSQQKIIEVLAATSGQPESYFNAQPTSVDLGTFAERFRKLERLITENALASEDGTISLGQAGKGPRMLSPDGTLYEITVKDGGAGFDIYEIS